MVRFSRLIKNDPVEIAYKNQILNSVAKKIDENPLKVEKVISATFNTLREVLSEADPEIRIEIRDFGVLEVKTTKAKPKARNPRTNEIVYVPARRKTHFKPGQILKKEMSRPL